MNIRVVEVGPRDGLQNESTTIDFEAKTKFIELLIDAGHQSIEFGSFVNPKAVPQMAETGALFQRIAAQKNLQRLALVPNRKGFEQAEQSGCEHIALFTSASETFNQKNIRASIDESFERMLNFTPSAQAKGFFMRGYVSTAFGCPFEGPVDPMQVMRVTQRLLEIGVHEVSISDTIGIADPNQVKSLVGDLKSILPLNQFALHFHDTRGLAATNVYAALELGVHIFDSSAGGLGGCPFAPNATGNVATEDLLFLFERLGLKTGIDLAKHIAASKFMQNTLKKKLPSRYLQSQA